MSRLASGVLLASLITAAPAFAFQCPNDMAAIDAALQAGAQLSEADLARARELRAEGERLHGAGQHQASVDALAEAKELLGL